MLALRLEGFLLVKFRNVNIAIMVGILKFGEGISMRRQIYSRVIESNLFQRLKIVIHNHLKRAHNCHRANLPRLKPTALDRRKSITGKRQGHVSHVLNAFCVVGNTLTIHSRWAITQDMKDDRNVMGCQIPCDIDVILKQPQVQPLGIDALDLPKFRCFDDLCDLHHRSRIEKSVPYH